MNCSWHGCNREAIWKGIQQQGIKFGKGGFASTPGEYHYCDTHKKIVAGYDIPYMSFRSEQ